VAPQPLGDLEPVDPRHHHVEEHQVWAHLGCTLERLFSVPRDRDVVPRRAKVHLDEASDVGLVIDHQNGLGHQRPPFTMAASSRAAPAGSSAPKMAAPATTTDAPASTQRRASANVIPPSAPISTRAPRRSTAARAAATLGRAPGSNAPGRSACEHRTVTRSTSPRKGSIAVSGVCRLTDSPTPIPASLALRMT